MTIFARGIALILFAAFSLAALCMCADSIPAMTHDEELRQARAGYEEANRLAVEQVKQFGNWQKSHK